MSDTSPFVLGTRGSNLALWQAHFVRDRLEAAGLRVRVQTLTTQGDRRLDQPLAKIGDKALFTKELDVALVEGRIDLAVHSLKDLPTTLPEGLALAAISERAAPWDAFVAHPSFEGTLKDLPKGATVATSSLRRQALLKAWRPDLRIVPVRGNVETRLAHLDRSDWHGMILATAGLERLGLDERIRERVEPAILLPAVSQGALGVVCRAGDAHTAEALRKAVHDTDTAAACLAERAFLRRLEGGCLVPIAGFAHVEDGMLHLEGAVAALDGREHLRARATAAPDEAEATGTALAETLLDRGAGEILRKVRAVQAEDRQPETHRPPPTGTQRVLLFRAARPEADPYEDAARDLGLAPTSVPVLRFERVDGDGLREVLAHPQRYGGLVVTSPRAAEALTEALRWLPDQVAQWEAGPVYAVGPRTAEVLEEAGLDTEGQDAGHAEALAAHILKHPPEAPLLFLCGTRRRDVLPDTLREAGLEVEEREVYATHLRDDLDLSAFEGVEVAAFFSPSGVEAVQQARGLGLGGLRRVALGPTTADALRAAGWPADAVAVAPEPDALAQALKRALDGDEEA